MRRLLFALLIASTVLAGLLCFCSASDDAAYAARAVNAVGLGAFGGDTGAAPVDAGPTPCCVGGFGAVPLYCSDAGGVSCLVQWEMNGTEITADAAEPGKIRPIQEWVPQGLPADPGFCIRAGNVGFASCEGGSCLQFTINSGDAASVCPTQGYDASAYLADAGIPFTNERVNIGYVQSTTPVYSYSIALETRAAFPVGTGVWPIAMTFYGVNESTGSCQLPDLPAAAWASPATCQFMAPAYQEYDIGEWQSRLVTVDNGFWGLSCQGAFPHTNQIFYTQPNIADFHTYDFILSGPDGGPLVAQWYVDGVLNFQLPGDGGCSGNNGQLPILAGPMFLAWGSTIGDLGGVYDASALPTYHYLTDYVRAVRLP